MKTRKRSKDIRKWLETQPPLDDLSKAYPQEWQSIQREIGDVLANGDFEKFKSYVQSVSRGPWNDANAPKGEIAILDAQVRQHMTVAALKQVCISSTTGVSSGRVRFNLLNGWVAQKLLFAHDLVRKPVSMTWFRLLWPLLWQRKFLMVLVQPKGIYCFYSKTLIKRLAKMIDGRSCVEIAAGDGTLSRFLRDAGVEITATDNYSWTSSVSFNESVEKQDAVVALRSRQPKVAICSWPPAGNPFEAEVFKTRSVELYIVIASKHEFGAGNWQTYRKQKTFEFAENPSLSRLVLPPEAESAVYVFRRIS